MVPLGAVATALRQLTLALSAFVALDAARRKKNAPLKLTRDRYFAPVRAREALKTIYFLRHGESQWNEAQANKDLLGMLGKYCSPLTRALQTCLVALRDHPCLRPRGGGVALVPACRELCYPVGGFDSIRGTTGTEILKRVVRRARKVAPSASMAPIVSGTVKVDVSEAEEDWWGPEGARAVSDRMQSFIDRLRGADEDCIIVVGHSLFFRTVFDNFASPSAKRGVPLLAHLAKKKLKNAAVAKVTLNCSEARFPIIDAELAFPEPDDGPEEPDR